jgi:acyl-CoA dehydrogenase
MTVDEAFGGAGADLLFPIILLEEQVRSDAPAINLSLHNDVVAPYLEKYGTQAQKAHYLPKMASGELIGAIAMTEPGAGSDLLAMQTTAVRSGENYVINGQKTFITNGHTADLVVLAARTQRGKGAKDISIFLLETANLPGFDRGRNIKKLGQHASDTAELYFSDVSVPASHLLGGEEGRGFYQLMDSLVYERLMAGAAAVAVIEHVIETTLAYVKEREAFGRRILDFQNSRFQLAECTTTAMVARRFLHRCLAQFRDHRLASETAAMLKWWTTDQQCKVVDACLQLHGGYGYIREYPIANMWADSRVAKIYGGSNEIMKEIIGRSL